MSRGSRGNRMQQLAALWLADCTSGLMQPLTRELIFHRGYVLPRFSLPSFHLLSLSLSFSLQLSFHGSFFIDCSTRPFVLVRVIYFPLHLWPWIRATPFTTLVESIAIYSSLPGRWDCLRSPFCSCDRSTMSLPPLLPRFVPILTQRDIARCNTTKPPRILCSSPRPWQFDPSFKISMILSLNLNYFLSQMKIFSI